VKRALCAMQIQAAAQKALVVVPLIAVKLARPAATQMEAAAKPMRVAAVDTPAARRSLQPVNTKE
jgi:hypothetical protein